MTSKKKSIARIFIANRGEIARRIALTAKRLGIQTVAISEQQIAKNYLSGVVSFFVIVPNESTSTYLNAGLMISLAKQAGCDAIHPGFGFLSESSEFAELVESHGLIWIGPRPGAVEAMASKATARQQAEKSGVPCLPGLNGIDLSKDESKCLAELNQFAEKFGYPILMKAAYGGGGKGMRIVRDPKDLVDQAKRAASEALSSFGNSSLIVEKYLDSPRHVEVQVLADKHGNVAIIGDRDCSLQRRHQKILEEAPAPNIPAVTRDAMHKSAHSLATAVGYDNAGTVEFLLDESDVESNQPKFYFLEMNTRLQVEHTVTEEVFGIDLVEWQIKVASNEALANELFSLKPRGHSVEVRIYAEDPGMNFFPAPGAVRAFLPATGKGVRWEIGLDTLDEISTKFDPMISKLVCTGSDRVQALELLAQTLERSQFSGPRNNIPFLIWLARHPKVQERPVDTHFIAQNVEHALKSEQNERSDLSKSADLLLEYIAGTRQSLNKTGQTLFGSSSLQVDSNLATKDIFSKSRSRLQYVDSPCQVTLTQSGVAKSVVYFDRSSHFGQGYLSRPDGILLGFNFTIYQSASSLEYWIGLNGHNWMRAINVASSAGLHSSNTTAVGLIAPVPGKVVAILIDAGQKVVKGQVVFVLESMKMQFEVKAHKDGELSEVAVKLGDQVAAGHALGNLE